MKKSIIILLTLLNFLSAAGTGTYLGTELPTSASVLGSGSAGVAMLGDVAYLELNPVSLAGTESMKFMFSHNEWIFNVNLETLFVAIPSKIGHLGGKVSFFYDAEAENAFDIDGNDMGKLKYNDLLIELVYGRKIGRMLYVGGGVNMMRMVNGLDGGLGVIFSVGSILEFNKNFRAGLSVRNLGTGPKIDSASYSTMPIIRLGAAYDIIPNEKNLVGFMLDGIMHPKSDSGFALGMRSKLFNLVNLRGGAGLTGSGGDWNFDYSFGGGVDLLVRSIRYSLDYAYKPQENIRGGHLLQLSVEFLPLAFAEVGLKDIEIANVVPAIYDSYHKEPLGTMEIENKSGAPLKNVEVTVELPDFSDSPFRMDTISEMAPKSNMLVDIFLKPSEKVLELDDNKKAAVKITVRYDSEGKPKEFSKTESITIFGKNTIDWNDDNMIGAFVTPSDKAIKRFTSRILSSYKKVEFPAVSDAMKKAIIMFDALGTYGLTYVADPNSPWNKGQERKIDTIQFPYETLELKTGDCDDISVLYATILESVGVETAFIYTPGHVYMMFNTGIPEYQAKQVTPRGDLVIIQDGSTWIPVEITMVGKTFFEAWQEGAKEYYANLEE